jgi:hypothetical protein
LRHRAYLLIEYIAFWRDTEKPLEVKTAGVLLEAVFSSIIIRQNTVLLSINEVFLMLETYPYPSLAPFSRHNTKTFDAYVSQMVDN